jgi:hypothetical protein
MFTNRGKLHIKRYIGGLVPSIGKSIAFGIGTTAASVNDYKLQFEVGRSDILLTSFDFVTNELIFKAPVTDNLAGVINEVGVYSLPFDSLSGGYQSKILSTFDPATETWVDATSGTAALTTSLNIRLGSGGIRQEPASSQTKTDTINQIFLDLGGYSGADRFVLAFNSGNTNANTVKVRFLTDASNYYEITFSGIVSGYNILEVTKSSATATGNPDWSNITKINVSTTSKSSGASLITLDGLRIDDADTLNPEYTLVSRKILPVSFIKEAGKVKEVEFRLGVNI